jgi:hypothetical protein
MDEGDPPASKRASRPAWSSSVGRPFFDSKRPPTSGVPQRCCGSSPGRSRRAGAHDSRALRSSTATSLAVRGSVGGQRAAPVRTARSPRRGEHATPWRACAASGSRRSRCATRTARSRRAPLRRPLGSCPRCAVARRSADQRAGRGVRGSRLPPEGSRGFRCRRPPTYRLIFVAKRMTMNPGGSFARTAVRGATWTLGDRTCGCAASYSG